MSRAKAKSLLNKAAYIDVTECGSIIGMDIHTRGTRLMGNIDLSDCNRKIQWYFSHETGTEKIDTAIALMKKFRAVWVKAVASTPSPRKRRSRS